MEIDPEMELENIMALLEAEVREQLIACLVLANVPLHRSHRLVYQWRTKVFPSMVDILMNLE
jgi:hypothetical protein